MPADTPLENAIIAHFSGRLSEARRGYEKTLESDPLNNEALHGLGLITADQGDPARAVALLEKCAGADPANVKYRGSLGYGLMRAGRAEEAVTLLRSAVELAPKDLRSRVYLAQAQNALGRWEETVGTLESAISAFPAEGGLWSLKGQAERRLERHAAAEQSFRRALELSPGNVETLNNLGVVVRAQGRFAEAVDLYRQVLAENPDHAVAHANLGNVLDLMDRTEEAAMHLRRAYELSPQSIDARYNLAAHLTRNERPDEALPHLETVTTAAPDRWDAWTNLGVARLAVGDVEGAVAACRRAIAVRPGNPEAHYDLAWALLLSGQWQEGWKEYEWRWELPTFSSRKRAFARPIWDGAPLPEGTLLLHAEQGLGDAIQFVRFAALAKQRAKRVVVECPAALVRLFETLPGMDAVVAAGKSLPAFDAHAPFMSLPRIFGITPDTVPGSDPYIPVPAAIPEHLRLPDGPGPAVGLVWAGSPDNKIDRRRTVPARMLAPLAAAAPARIVSLQVGPKASEAADLGPVAFAVDGVVKDFADTAAVVAQLDLVIGVDTAVMHLAAAMGKPTWMLAPFMPDYRWLLGREDTPWYRAMRLFRQRKRGEWPEVVDRAAAALTLWQQSRG